MQAVGRACLMHSSPSSTPEVCDNDGVRGRGEKTGALLACPLLAAPREDDAVETQEVQVVVQQLGTLVAALTKEVQEGERDRIGSECAEYLSRLSLCAANPVEVSNCASAFDSVRSSRRRSSHGVGPRKRFSFSSDVTQSPLTPWRCDMLKPAVEFSTRKGKFLPVAANTPSPIASPEAAKPPPLRAVRSTPLGGRRVGVFVPSDAVESESESSSSGAEGSEYEKGHGAGRDATEDITETRIEVGTSLDFCQILDTNYAAFCESTCHFRCD